MPVWLKVLEANEGIDRPNVLSEKIGLSNSYVVVGF
jgi:hypothetical protein